MNLRRLAAIGALIGAVAFAVVLVTSSSGSSLGKPARAPQTAAWPPLPKQVQVEVLNASGLASLARVTTVRLREAGLDVVYFGAGDSSQARGGITRVIVRGTDTTGLGRILEVLQTTAVEYQAPANRWVDFSVWIAGPLPSPKVGQ